MAWRKPEKPEKAACSPGEAWAAARLSLPHVARKISDERWRAYWDMIADSYGLTSGAGSQLDADIFRGIKEDGTFMPGDTVLDIGCGPGTFALQFAADARHVCGLDLSAGMLRRLRETALSKGIGNVSTVESAWSEYAPGEKYDLVFSSFCPAMNDPVALLKMERHAHRRCCYVSIADGSHRTQPLYMLWEELTGEIFSNKGYDIAYPFDYLSAMGREPRVRYFHTTSETCMPIGKAVEKYTAYFRMFADLDAAGERHIGDFVRQRATEGMFRHIEQRTVGIIDWQPLHRTGKRGHSCK